MAGTNFREHCPPRRQNYDCGQYGSSQRIRGRPHRPPLLALFLSRVATYSAQKTLEETAKSRVHFERYMYEISVCLACISYIYTYTESAACHVPCKVFSRDVCGAVARDCSGIGSNAAFVTDVLTRLATIPSIFCSTCEMRLRTDEWCTLLLGKRAYDGARSFRARRGVSAQLHSLLPAEHLHER
jgi:hypothetical protein